MNRQPITKTDLITLYCCVPCPDECPLHGPGGALEDLLRDSRGQFTTLKHQELADLRTLLSIACWIRGEQLAHPDSFLLMHERGSEGRGVLVSEVDTHYLHISRARAEFQAAQQWCKKLDELIGPNAKPSWDNEK